MTKGNEKIILYLGGGSMAGVFGAGIMTKLQEKNFYDRIEVIYAGSAGVFNAAYFLAKQTEMGSTIYWENLTKNFIFKERFFERFYLKHKKGFSKIVDIDYLMKISKTKKRLDIEKVKKNTIPTYAKLFDLKTQKIKWVDIRKTPLKTMREAVSLVPFYVPKKNQRNIDADVLSGIKFKELRKKYPERKIIVCLNHSPKTKVVKRISKLIESELTKKMFPGKAFYKLYLKKIPEMEKEIKIVNKDKNALLIFPDKKNKTNNTTIEKSHLLKTYNLGKKEALKIIAFANKK